MDRIRDKATYEEDSQTYDIGTPPIVEMTPEPALWNAAADMPVWTWSQLEDALGELAASRHQHAYSRGGVRWNCRPQGNLTRLLAGCPQKPVRIRTWRTGRRLRPAEPGNRRPAIASVS